MPLDLQERLDSPALQDVPEQLDSLDHQVGPEQLAQLEAADSPVIEVITSFASFTDLE